MSEHDAPRIYGGGTMGGVEIRTLTKSQRETGDLVDLADAGFRIFRQADLIHKHRPWLVAREDRSVWQVERGVPASGITARTHAILIDDDSLNWGYLVAARHAGRDDPPSADDLERRAQEQAEAAKRQEAEREAKVRELRKSATPVTVGHFDPAMRMTLRTAHEQVLNAGGTVTLNKDGDVVVSLPPNGMAWGGLSPARVLYAASPHVAACLRDKHEFPDREVLPNGALA